MAITKQDVIDYVLKTPLNTNKAILTAMLDELAGSDPVLPDDDVIVIYDGGRISA